MGCINTLFLILLGGIYFFWPELMQVEGFWYSFIAIWLCFFISWALFGHPVVTLNPLWGHLFTTLAYPWEHFGTILGPKVHSSIPKPIPNQSQAKPKT